MIKKEVGLKLFLGIFLLMILSSGVLAVEVGTCDIVAQDECSNDDTTGYILMGLSSATNSHGELGKFTCKTECVGLDKNSCNANSGCSWERSGWSPYSCKKKDTIPCEGLSSTECKSTPGCIYQYTFGGGYCKIDCLGFETEAGCLGEEGCFWDTGYISVTYPYVLCCNFGEGDTTCDGANKIIGLSAITNAHAEGKTGTSYTNNVCYEDISCRVDTSCDADENEILSLTSTTNAHIGGAEDYPNKVCCTKESMAWTICEVSSVNWTDSEGDVISVALQNNEVNMRILGNGCSEKSVSLQVYEDKLGDSKVGNLITKEFGASDRIIEPLGIVREVGSSYYFTADVEGLEEVQSGNLIIRDNYYCVTETLDVCGDYDNKEDCTSDLCDVAEDEINGMQENKDFCDTYNCGCSWNDEENICKAEYGIEPIIQGCGDGTRETGEECDDGNLRDGDGCSATCELEGVSGPCRKGLTLCGDGTCSLNCPVTDTDFANCNYNSVCETGEGCTCSDCENQQDTCQEGLVCNVIDSACCSGVSDGICNPYCSYIDPDCTPSKCGNGEEEKGEECDDGNLINRDGCSATCKLEEIIPISEKCPEGLSLCNDGNCSLNCFATDAGIDPICRGVGCCQSGLTYSEIDLACCNPNSDSKCNLRCSYIDPDCTKEIIDPFMCRITQTVENGCEEEPIGQKIVSWKGEWLGEETSGEEYDKCITGGESTIGCAAKLQLPFFDYIEFIIAIVIIAIIYTAVIYNKKHKSKKKRQNKK